MQILIRANEACRPDPYLLWDSIFNPAAGIADWALASCEPLNVGGLSAQAGLDTAVTLCLFTDAAIAPSHPLFYLVDDGDPRGWWGDGIDVRTDLGEGPLGSLLWVLQRAPLTPAIAAWAQQLAHAALSPLQTQGAVVNIAATATIAGTDELQLAVALYGRNGQQIYNRQFDLLWNQAQAGSCTPAPVLTDESGTNVLTPDGGGGVLIAG
jgi:phage gp46-like protein